MLDGEKTGPRATGPHTTGWEPPKPDLTGQAKMGQPATGLTATIRADPGSPKRADGTPPARARGSLHRSVWMVGAAGVLLLTAAAGLVVVLSGPSSKDGADAGQPAAQGHPARKRLPPCGA
jgi:hypothetical protein